MLDNISGMLYLNKPEGVSSASIDYRIKRLIANLLGVSKKKAPKVGHAGTLDPFATGVLIVGVGECTKDLHFYEKDSKEYRAEIILGIQKDTDDLTGNTIKKNSCDDISYDKISETLMGFVGEYLQTPSNFSAKRVKGSGGKRAHQMMRSDKEFNLDPVKVTIHEIDIDKSSYKRLVLDGIETVSFIARFKVSKGTYIRAIARDLGNKLDVGGFVQSLERLSVGKDVVLSKTLNIDEVEKFDLANFSEQLIKYPFGSSATFGTFDAMHLGHQKLIKKTVEIAKENHQKSIVFVIDRGVSRLTSLEYRKNLIYSLGVSQVIVLKLDDVQNLKYDEFIEELIKKYSLKNLVMTKDMKFGKNQSGNISVTSEKFGKDINIIDTPLELSNCGYNQKISSTDIVNYIKCGDISIANKMLGRNYKIKGFVIRGFQRGREIGFPTANLDANKIMITIPTDGVYFGKLECKSKKYSNMPAAISIGTNPTFNNIQRTVEVHVPERKDLELYDEEINISIIDKISDTKKFASIEDLKNSLAIYSKITLASDALLNNQIIAMPTDTVYGVMCRYPNEELKDRLFKLKKRDKNKKLQVLVDSYESALKIANFNKVEKELADKYWPGAMTLVVNDIGFRVPKCDILRSILKITGPVYASSLNISGECPVIDVKQAKNLFQDQIDLFIDGEINSDNVSSTVCRVLNQEVEILRQGSLNIKI